MAGCSPLQPVAGSSILEDDTQRYLEANDPEEDNCIICLQAITDRTLLPACKHQSACFQCILAWIATSTTSSGEGEVKNTRRCPLCNTGIGEYIVHGIRGEDDFERYWLAPPVETPLKRPTFSTIRQFSRTREMARRQRARREVRWGKRNRFGEVDELERTIERRRFIYRNDLYAKHVAANRHTRYKPCPTPSQIASSSELCSRVLKFTRRELRVWEGLDGEFLTHYILSLLRVMDLRSESAVKLLSEFLDSDDAWIPELEDLLQGEDSNRRHAGGASSEGQRSSVSGDSNPRKHAEHFVHELYTYLRSPFTDLANWDKCVQYEQPFPQEKNPRQPTLHGEMWR